MGHFYRFPLRFCYCVVFEELPSEEKLKNQFGNVFTTPWCQKDEDKKRERENTRSNINNPKDLLKKLQINFFNFVFWGVWDGFGGCLGEFSGDVWRVFGSLFVVFWRDLGVQNRGKPEGKKRIKNIIFNF